MLRAENASAVEVIARTTRIEIDVAVVKGEVARLRQDVSELREDISQLREDISQLRERVTRLETDLSALRKEVSLLRGESAQLREDVTQLREDVTQLREKVSQFQMKNLEEFAGIKLELTKLATQQAKFEAHCESHFASKADLKASESNTRAWMLGIALTIITLNFAMIYPLYGALKTSPLSPAMQTQQAPAPAANQPAAGLR